MLSTPLTIENSLIMIGSYFGSVLIFFQLTRIKTQKRRMIIIFFIDLLIILCLAILKNNNSVYIKLLFIIMSCVSFVCLPNKANVSLLPISIISVSLSFCFEYWGVLLSGTILYFLNFKDYPVVAAMLSTSFQIISILLLLMIKRIRKFFLFLDKKENFGLGLLLSSYNLLFSVLITTKTDYFGNEISAMVFSGIPLALTGLILWIHSIVQRYYKKKISVILSQNHLKIRTDSS